MPNTKAHHRARTNCFLGPAGWESCVLNICEYGLTESEVNALTGYSVRYSATL